MLSRFERFLIAIMFALLFAGVTLMVAQADVKSAPAAQATTENCGLCHQQFVEYWQGGPHGNALTDPVFNDSWTSQGKPGACLVCHTTGYDPASGTWKEDSVACGACHKPIPDNHPNDPMPVDTSTDLCGTCHSATRFGWRDWKVSAHYQRNMTCSVCHDVHSAGLKTVSTTRVGLSKSEAASELCINCHREYTMQFSYSTHHKQGVSCVDCHLKHLELGDSEPHTVPDHSFNADLSTCTVCHAEQMHGSTEQPTNGVAATPQVPEQAVDTNLQLASVTPEPTPVSPIGFAGLAALIGLGVGMILSPWLERLYHHMNKNSGEDNNE